MGGGWLYAVLVPALFLSTGCFEPAAEAKARLAETKTSGAALIAKLDGLEDRFLGNQANIKIYAELKRRHQSVSAIACANQSEHYSQMVTHLAKMQEKSRKLRRARQNVASAKVTLTSASSSSAIRHKAHD